MNVILLLHPKDTVAYVHADDTLRQGLEKIKAHGYTAIPVIHSDGTYAGSVSEGDFLWHMLQHPEEGGIRAQEKYTISDIIRPGWTPAVRADVTMEQLLEHALNQNFIPVTDDRNVFIGIVTRKDVIGYFMGKRKSPLTAI